MKARQRSVLAVATLAQAVAIGVTIGVFPLFLEPLEAGFEAGDPLAPYINFMNVYDPLRDNPRFQAMLRKMNLLED